MFTYICDKKNNLTSDSERINVVLSYIRGDHVDAWVQNYLVQNFDEEVGMDSLLNRVQGAFEGAICGFQPRARRARPDRVVAPRARPVLL